MELKGTAINFLGDSITEGVGASEVSKRYTDILAREEELVKEKIVSVIDEYTAGIAGGDTYGVPSVASGLTLTYKEYLKVSAKKQTLSGRVKEYSMATMKRLLVMIYTMKK